MNISKRTIYVLGLLFTDMAAIFLAYYLAYEIRFFNAYFLLHFPIEKGLPSWSIYANLLKLILPLWIIVFTFWGRLYHSRFSSFADEFLAIIKSAALSCLLTIFGTFLYRGYEYSRLVLGIGSLLAVILLLLSHESWKMFLNLFLQRWIPHDTTVVIGESKSLERVRELLKRDVHRRAISFSLTETDRILECLTQDRSIDEIITSAETVDGATHRSEYKKIFDVCQERNISIKVLPDLLETRLGEIIVDESLGIPVLQLKSVSLHGFQYIFKRVFDVSLSLIILTVFGLAFAAISLCIWLDSPGGVFFIQERVGFKEKHFFCLKFRTMRQDAEEILAKMQLSSFRGGPAFKMKNDPRITRVGKFLRKLSLDEFPQIWNILRGEMSFIGPRPQVLKEAAGNPEWAKKRFRLLPGITGLWQVSGRADLSYEEMMRLDVYYLENWSPGLDLKIVLKTVPVVLNSKGAY